MTAISIPLDLRYPVADRAISEDADRLRGSLRDAARPDTSVSLADAEEKLQAALAEAWKIDADVDLATEEYARSFLNALPLALQRSVDVQVEPAGEVVFEWESSPRWILTLAINERGRIAYSGIFGSGRTRGSEIFEGTVPDAVALSLARVCQR
ncbi:MAG: hypothetical protein IPM29_32325 [Planctomycetes bacterium]|nr:hypothetical protein [Planctomycetota bacterium]